MAVPGASVVSHLAPGIQVLGDSTGPAREPCNIAPTVAVVPRLRTLAVCTVSHAHAPAHAPVHTSECKRGDFPCSFLRLQTFRRCACLLVAPFTLGGSVTQAPSCRWAVIWNRSHRYTCSTQERATGWGVTPSKAGLVAVVHNTDALDLFF